MSTLELFFLSYLTLPRLFIFCKASQFMYRIMYRIWLRNRIGNVLWISVVICACLEYGSIMDVARSLSRMDSDNLSDVGERSSTLRASLPILARNLFFAAALRTQSDSDKSTSWDRCRYFGPWWHLYSEVTSVSLQKQNSEQSSEHNSKQKSELNSEQKSAQNIKQLTKPNRKKNSELNSKLNIEQNIQQNREQNSEKNSEQLTERNRK